MWSSGAVLAGVLFGVGLTIGWVRHVENSGAPAAPPDGASRVRTAAAQIATGLPVAVTQIRSSRTGLSHPLLFCDDAAADNRVDALHDAANGVLVAARATGALQHASIVYRALEAGRGFEIDGQRHYHPASLLKLPLAIAWMRHAESNPGVLARKLPYNNQTLRESADTPGALVSGESYSARELLERMIRWSRNDAKAILAQELGEGPVKEVYAQLEIAWPFGSPNVDPELSAHEYSRLFRVIYDASMLHPTAADELLQMLARTEYEPALRAGVPSGTQIAHKWGHRLLKEPGQQGVHQLHDCGIVYQPGRPFLLCVMTSGRDELSLAKVIADVARKAWDAGL